MQLQFLAESKPRVLFVDDDLMVLTVISTLLLRRGIPVHTCSNGGELFASCERHSFPLVFLDVHLGTENGLSLLVELIDLHPGIKVVIMTGSETDENLRSRAIQLGALDVISKGSTLSSIERLIHQFA